MPSPSLSSFISSNQYVSETVTTNPLVAGFYAGGTATARYTPPTFTGVSGAASNDPGGLFGWLIYARTALAKPTKGATTDTYLVYTNPGSLVGDLNLLGRPDSSAVAGATSSLISTSAQGGTYGLFLNTGLVVTPRSAGTDFLHAINYLAYGGTLVLVGTTAGFDDYMGQTGTNIDVLIGTTANSSLVTWLNNTPYTVGIFPSIADSNGQIGAGYTMAPFDTLGVTTANLAVGSTFSTRVFNVCGTKVRNFVDTSSLIPSSYMTNTVLPCVSDVAGMFNRSKVTGSIYLSVAGVDIGKVLNGTVSNSLSWANTTLKTKLKDNRVNFFVNYTPAFLGQDLLGATANSSAVIPQEKIGASEIRLKIDRDVTNIALKYLYLINNDANRRSLVTDVTSYLGRFAGVIDPTYTQVNCDSGNNTDNSTTLNVEVIVKPILSTDTLVITTSLTA